jgi:transcriptional regulator with XRE-family HTH domain
MEPVDVLARRRLRELRTERGLTLQQVAERASIDLSTLSRLEAGKRRLALDHIPALAAALGVTSDDLLRAAPRPDPRVRSRPRHHDGMTVWSLARSGLRAFRVRIGPERRTPPDVLPVHEGNDWIYVLSGRLRLLLGDQDLTLEPGETAEFSTWTPHWFGTVDGPVELILIVGPQGERLHLSR